MGGDNRLRPLAEPDSTPSTANKARSKKRESKPEKIKRIEQELERIKAQLAKLEETDSSTDSDWLDTV